MITGIQSTRQIFLKGMDEDKACQRLGRQAPLIRSYFLREEDDA